MTAHSEPSDLLYDRFQSPEDRDKPAPLWFWNRQVEDMTEEQVRELVRESYIQSGYSGFGILPEWQTAYFSEDYFKLYEAALDEGSKYGMKFSLYDENGFPSYNAGGLLEEQYPELTVKRLDMIEENASNGADVRLKLPEGKLMGAVAMNTETYERIDITDQAVIHEPAPFDPDDVPLGVSASTTYSISPGYDAGKAVDGDLSTRWNSESMSGGKQYLQIRFSQPTAFDSVKIYEDSDKSLQRTRTYTVQYWNDAENCWTDLAAGQTITSDGAVHTFDAVTAEIVRLYINRIEGDSATISEFQVWNKDSKLAVPASEQVPDGDDTEPEGSYLEYTVPAGNWKVMAFMCVVDGRDGMDYLSKEAVSAFIDITYEEYYKRFKKYFDNGTITSAFFDEPSFWPAGGRTPYGAEGARFWTPGFNQDYEDTFGESPVLNYPALFMDIGEMTNEARDKLEYVRTEEFAYNYIGQVNEWCRDHGIQLTGHMLFEEWTNPVGVHGDLMKVFKEQAMPGVDVISNYGYTQEAYKIVSSSANNWDKAVVMSESFGVFQNKDMGNFYKSAMDQFTKGVSLIIPHAMWYDDDPQYVTYVPELSYRSPEFGPNLPALNDFIARGHVMLQGGRHVADIGMLYPIDTLESEYYFDGDPNNPEYADYMQVSEILSLSARRDFTYLHPDVLDEKCSVEGAELKLNNENNYEQYKVMIMPGMEVISLSNLEKIKAFYDAGGKVIATTQLPYRATLLEDNAKVKAIISEMFGVNPENMPAVDRPVYNSSSDYSTNYNAACAFDGAYGDNSRWNAGVDGAGQWLEVEFPQAVSIDRTVITERFDRVRGYQIQYFDETAGSYKTCVTGGAIGANKTDTFTPVTTKKLRLYITNLSVNSVSIEEFEVYSGGKNIALDTSGIRFKNSNQAGGTACFIDSSLSKNILTALDDALEVYDVNIADPGQLSDGYLSYIHKVRDNRNLYYFANSSSNAVSTTVQIRGRLNSPALWNPYDGSSVNAEYEHKIVAGQEITEITLNLLAVDSVYLVESVPAPADKTALKAAIDNAETINGNLDGYLDGVAKDAFVSAFDSAKNVYNDSSASQEEVNSAAEALSAAVSALTQKADKTALEAAVEKANKLDRNLYTDDSLPGFISALNNAERLLNDDTLSAADQATLDSALEDLQRAVDALVLKFDPDVSSSESDSSSPESDSSSPKDEPSSNPDESDSSSTPPDSSGSGDATSSAGSGAGGSSSTNSTGSPAPSGNADATSAPVGNAPQTGDAGRVLPAAMLAIAALGAVCLTCKKRVKHD